MESFLIKAAQLMLAFAILVTVHEFGHYIFARMFGMRVDRFYLFFNPWFSLFKYYPDKGKVQIIAWTKKVGDKEEPKALITLNAGKPHAAMKNGKPTWADTLYGIGWIPLGGYCSIAGMIDETTDKDQLAAEPESWEFRAKKPVPRLLVMLAGVIFNFILAIIIYIGMAVHWGERYVPFENATEGMDYAQPLQNAGLRNGDILLAINGEKARANDESLGWDMLQDGTTLTVLRNHADTVSVTLPAGFLKSLIKEDQKSAMLSYRTPVKVLKTVAGEPAEDAGLMSGDRILRVANDTTPSLTEFYPALMAHKSSEVPMLVLRDGKEVTVNCAISENGKIGIQLTPPTEIYGFEETNYNIFQAIPKGIDNGVTRLSNYVSSLKLLFTKEGAQSIGGFGAIGDMYPDKWNWYSFWDITAFLSIILAFMNILPIPALDGGHVVFTLWEIVIRRKPSIKVLEYAQMAGMAFLFLLLIYANANDIYRFFLK